MIFPTQKFTLAALAMAFSAVLVHGSGCQDNEPLNCGTNAGVSTTAIAAGIAHGSQSSGCDECRGTGICNQWQATAANQDAIIITGKVRGPGNFTVCDATNENAKKPCSCA